ncbi:hypothetical protein [Fulvivirga sedimenti]|uniref:hypothetical protein n=1 Tax=Fulvivirga sedimenti TaxID=2879465 RepID=UPI001CE33653|nr:hypothetical protein [Fulvivirga sedimenti]
MKNQILTALLLLVMVSMGFVEKQQPVTTKTKKPVITKVPSSNGITKEDKVRW